MKNLVRFSLFINLLSVVSFIVYFVNCSFSTVFCSSLFIIGITLVNFAVLRSLDDETVNEILFLDFFKKIGCDFSNE